MNMLFPCAGGLNRGLPDTNDDVACSAAAGQLIVEAYGKRREPSPFKVGDIVAVRDGIKVLLGGRRYIDCNSGSVAVEEIGFSSDISLVDGEPVVIGWIARFRGAKIFVACSSLC